MDNMTPKELRELANQVREQELASRPSILKAKLMGMMKDNASRGYFYLDYMFCDSQEIADKTIGLLKKEGFKISKLDYKSVIRFEW